MFGPDKLLILVLSAVAVGVAWLLLYDVETKKWNSPTDPKIAVGYAVMVVSMIGILFVMNFQPFSPIG
jgi:hypothetical protein